MGAALLASERRGRPATVSRQDAESQRNLSVVVLCASAAWRETLAEVHRPRLLEECVREQAACAYSSRQTPLPGFTEIRNTVSRQDAEPQRGSFLSLRLRGLARNITVEDHRRRILGECFAEQAARQHSSRDTPLPSPRIQEFLAKMCHFWHNED